VKIKKEKKRKGEKLKLWKFGKMISSPISSIIRSYIGHEN